MFWAIIAATVVNQLIGMLWYSKPLFGEHWLSHWIQHTRRTKKEFAQMKISAKQSMLGAVLVSLLTNVVLAAIFNRFDISSVGEGVMLGFWIWLGFTATTGLYDVLFENKPWQLYTIHSLHFLLAMLASGAIIGGW
jgi:hypothetical protein